MHSSTILTLLPALVAAAPFAARDSSTDYYITATRSGSIIHLQSVNASDFGFYIGKDTAAYCPPGIQGCPQNTFTGITVASQNAGGDTAFMDALVPGGQQVYVAPNGALSYTQAHSQGSPDGSIRTGFSTDGPAANGLSELLFSGNGSTGFLACPASKGGEQPYPYQVFADISGLEDSNVPSGHKADCLGFAMTLSQTAEIGAWQYN